ncbi:MAG TPA: alkaline ceramidase [Enterococcus sp.]|nr:alkaline ceramidase [Enterococcus sp.]
MINAGSGKSVIDLNQGLLPIEDFEYVYDELLCRVLILVQMETFVFVSLDLTSLQDYAIESIKKEIQRNFSVDVEHIFISVTHTFSAPHTRSKESLNVANPGVILKNNDFLKTLLKAVSAAMKLAINNIQPVYIEYTSGTIDTNINRDILTKDGYWIGRNSQGFSNKSVPIIKLFSENHKLLSIIYSIDVQSSLVAHIDVKAVSSDLIGNINKNIEKALDCTAIFLLGAAGDQVPKVASETFDSLEAEAMKVTNQLIANIECCGVIVKDTIKIDTIVLKVKGQRIPKIKSLKATNKYSFIEWGEQTISVQLLRLGSIAIVMMKPELISITGEQIRQASPFDLTLIATMINGGQKYMADERSYCRFTYEAMNSMFAKGSAEFVRDAIVEKLIEGM